MSKNFSNLTNYFFKQNGSISIEQIKTFMCVYELGSLSLAANATHKTQPAISHSISKLEEKLGIKLLNRNRGKTISFTEAGHHFYQTVSPLLTQLLSQLADITSKNTVSIGVCDEVPLAIQRHILKDISEKTGQHVRLICDFSAKLKVMVTDGRISFAVCKQIIENRETPHQFIWTANQKKHFDDSESLAVVTAHAGCLNRYLLEQTLSKVGKDYHFSYLSNNLRSQAEVILSGFGVGLLDKSWLQNYPELIELTTAQGFPKLPHYRYQCIGSADNHISTRTKTLLNSITDHLNTSMQIK